MRRLPLRPRSTKTLLSDTCTRPRGAKRISFYRPPFVCQNGSSAQRRASSEMSSAHVRRMTIPVAKTPPSRTLRCSRRRARPSSCATKPVSRCVSRNSIVSTHFTCCRCGPQKCRSSHLNLKATRTCSGESRLACDAAAEFSLQSRRRQTGSSVTYSCARSSSRTATISSSSPPRVWNRKSSRKSLNSYSPCSEFPYKRINPRWPRTK